MTLAAAVSEGYAVKDFSIDKKPPMDPLPIAETIPIEDGSAPEKVLKEHKPTHNDAGDEVPEGNFYGVHPVTKLVNVYTSIAGGKSLLQVTSTDNVGSVLFTYDGERIVLTAKNLNRMQNLVSKCKTSDECYETIKRVFTSSTTGIAQPDMIASITQYIMRHLIKNKALKAHINASMLGKMYDSATNETLLPYRGFVKSLVQYGLLTTLRLWRTNVNCCGCNGGVQDIGNLNLGTPAYTLAN
jgi:hypothetical protein